MRLTEVILGRSRRAGSAGRPGDRTKLRRTSARLPIRRAGLRPGVAGLRPGEAGRSAVTLPELILVIVILGILAAVAVPRFAESNLLATKAEGSVKDVVATLRLARRMAIDRAATNPNGFCAIGSGDTYSVYAADTGRTEGAPKRLASGWLFPIAYTVRFNTLGSATNLAGGMNAIDIQKGGETWRIELYGATGGLRYYKRN